MKDDEFNFHRLAKSEKKVAKPALQDAFETLWNRKYFQIPWKKNAESVKLFEEKEHEHFQNSLEGLSNKKKGKKKSKRKELQDTFRDDQWNNYEWDTNKYVYALVEGKLFTLDQTDETGMPVSEHIVEIKKIRNKIAHSPTQACDDDYFENTLKLLGDHIKALEIVQLNAAPHLQELLKIKSEEKPVSAKEHFELKLHYIKLEYSEKIYEERGEHSKEIIMLLKQQKEKSQEDERLSKEINKKVEGLETENRTLKENVKRLTEENMRLKTENRPLQKRINSVAEVHASFSEGSGYSYATKNRTLQDRLKSLFTTIYQNKEIILRFSLSVIVAALFLHLVYQCDPSLHKHRKNYAEELWCGVTVLMNPKSILKFIAMQFCLFTIGIPHLIYFICFPDEFLAD